MAIARMHGGPLDGQLIPLDDPEMDRLILPYSETQVVYEREGAPENTGDDDGPTEATFRFVESQDDIDPDPDDHPDLP
ncbi:response regulator [Microbacterium sp. zg.Y625]|uniref:response regulator n=1 Tax=Microbacterium jiangjiandongii TaxID=3049071 RepID=UPI00214B1F01|nr:MULTISPECIES: response regulator [unclassified Microbacterium]MCR2792434.1 response regulator [Microbacterium sp. zg.Y625]WIM26428.1 response regulator [Microbacterium sp. zg-Y625]